MMALVLEHHAIWHYDGKEYDMARLLYENCNRYSTPRPPWVLDRLIRILYGLGETDAMAAKCNEAVAMDPRNKYAWSMLGRAYAKLGQAANAAKCF
jgi:tetratricopeptide (TPR) repeat protein